MTRTGVAVLRWGLVLVLAWFGAFKFTETEAKAIEPLVGNSPFLAWIYDVTDVRNASRLIGVAELVIAGLIALKPFAPRLGGVGSLLASGMFLTTLSFLATTPGVFVRVDGFVVPSALGAFLLKDVFLLGAALVTVGEALGRPAPEAQSPTAG